MKLYEPLAFALIVKFTFNRPRMEDIHAFFHSMKLSGIFSVGLPNARHIIIKLANDLNYRCVFAKRSYHVFNCQMCLLKWTLYFIIMEKSPIMSAWIFLSNLRMYLFNHCTLHDIGSLLGRALNWIKPPRVKFVCQSLGFLLN